MEFFPHVDSPFNYEGLYMFLFFQIYYRRVSQERESRASKINFILARFVAF